MMSTTKTSPLLTVSGFEWKVEGGTEASKRFLEQPQN